MWIPVTFTNSLLLVTADLDIRYCVFVTLIITESQGLGSHCSAAGYNLTLPTT